MPYSIYIASGLRYLFALYIISAGNNDIAYLDEITTTFGGRKPDA